MNKRNKKKLQTEQLFGERLLKAGRIILLIVPTIFLTTPIVVFVLDSMAMKYYLEDLGYAIIGFLLSLLMYVLLHFWVLRRRSRYDQYARGELPDVIKVKAPYRQRGIGTALMQAMLTLLKTEGYKQVSLSVQKANYARKLYLKLGFEIVKTNEEDEIMVYKKEK